MMQKCTKCGTVKSTDCFYEANNGRGTMAACKECKKRENSTHRSKPEVKERVSELNKIWVSNNRERKRENDRAWQVNNKERYKDSVREWEQQNREKLSEYRRKYRQSRLDSDVNFKIASNLRSRLTKAVSRDQKSGSAVEDLGCSIEELKEYLENKFENGMSWSNYGDWHIDHIVPLSSFDLTDHEQLKEACHYTNLQPMWAEDNLKKSNT